MPSPGSSGPSRPAAAYIGTDITTAKVTHRSGGTAAERTVEGEELDALREWASGLKYEILEFEEGQSPGGYDGGEVYDIDLIEGPYLCFSYVIHGADDRCLLIEGYWYSVTDPSDPPVDLPIEAGPLTVGAAEDTAKEMGDEAE